MALRRAMGGAALLLVAVVITVVVAEAALRLFDGYPLLRLHLGLSPVAVRRALEHRSLARLAATFTTDPDVDPAWIDDPPPAVAAVVDPELVARRDALRHP